MPACPAGHTSASDDFCDVCGMRTGAAAGGPAGPLPEPPSPVPAEPCPRCGTARSGPFCTSCGYGYEAGQAPAAVTAAGAVPGGDGSAAESGLPSGGPPASGEPGPAAGGPPTAPGGAVAWTAVVASDHTYFEDVIAGGGPDAASLTFPAYIPERQFQLAGPEVRIGRRSPSQGLEPEIDLTGPPADPGVSRLHAVLLAEPDGSWAVLDPGSENGTHVNGSEIATGVRVPLGDGDRIHVGAWTVITIHAS